jgi:hypothetical protein
MALKFDKKNLCVKKAQISSISSTFVPITNVPSCLARIAKDDGNSRGAQMCHPHAFGDGPCRCRDDGGASLKNYKQIIRMIISLNEKTDFCLQKNKNDSGIKLKSAGKIYAYKLKSV